VITRRDEQPSDAKPAELVGADGRTAEPSPDGFAPTVPEASINGPWRRILVLPDRSGTLHLTAVDSARSETTTRDEELRFLDE